jgi:hypothetical protein
MAQNSGGTGTKAPSTILVCILLFVVYNSNFRLIHSGDSVPARLLPFSVVIDRHLYLDNLIEPYLVSAPDPPGIFFATKTRGHWMSTYPIITPLVVSPLYWLPAWWLSEQDPPLTSGDVVLLGLIDIMEKLSASLLATLSAGILYSAFRKVASPLASLLLTLVYGLASNTWTISSQALWRHGLTELSFALLLWALLRGPARGSSALWAGIALGMAAANKPADAVFGLAFFAYFARHHRKNLLAFSAPLMVVGIPVVSYNLYYFGHLLGGYPNVFIPVAQSEGVGGFFPSVWKGFAGLLVSPNRGLLIYMPWTVFALWGAVRLWKGNAYDWGRYLIPSMAAFFFLHARFGRWWGGWCFGPRYLTDLLPLFAFFLIPVWSRVQAAPLLRAALVLATAVAIWIQVVGAFYYPNGWWDSRPASVDVHPRRLWDWSDTQIARTWKAGSASPDLFYEAYLVFGGGATTDRGGSR